MPLTDELTPIPRVSAGPRCAIQHLRDARGDEFAREVLDLVSVADWSVAEKKQVLARHGLDFHRQFIDRHRRGDCQGCTRWLS